MTDGSVKFLSFKVIVERDEQKNQLQFQGTVADITEDYFTFNNLKNNEKYSEVCSTTLPIFLSFWKL